MTAPFGLPGRVLRFGVVGGVVALIAALGWKASLGSPQLVEPPTATVTLSAAAFRPKPAQWESLTIKTVGLVNFDSVVIADGVVTTNDNATAVVYSQFSGRVVAIYAQPGQDVRKGAPLLALLATEAAQSKGDLAVAAAAEATARKQLELATLTERRQHELLLAEAGTEKDWQQSKTDLEAAENAHRAARAAFASAREKAAVLTNGPPDRAGHAGEAVVSAPIDGVVLQRQVAPGQFINSLAIGGSTPLYTISDLHTVWVVASVSEIDAGQVTLGQPMEITALSLPGRTQRARVSWISATVDPGSRRIAVRAELPNPILALKPQMSVTVRLLEAHSVATVAVPRSAVVYEGRVAHCYVATTDRTLVARTLEIGRVQGDLAEVKSGLTSGEQVVTRGTLFIDRAVESEGS